MENCLILACNCCLTTPQMFLAQIVGVARRQNAMKSLGKSAYGVWKKSNWIAAWHLSGTVNAANVAAGEESRMGRRELEWKLD